LGLLGALFLLAGCGGGSDTGGETLGFVGAVDGTNAFVSVVVADGGTAGDEAIVYVCDGEAEIREWFRGPIDDPTHFNLSNDAGAGVNVTLGDGGYSGEFTQTSGPAHAFTTVQASGDAGLYEVDDPTAAEDGVWAAWIVDNDGNERGAFLRRGKFRPTPRLRSTSFRLSRFGVRNGVIDMNGIIAPNR